MELNKTMPAKNGERITKESGVSYLTNRTLAKLAARCHKQQLDSWSRRASADPPNPLRHGPPPEISTCRAVGISSRNTVQLFIQQGNLASPTR
jgi:hypothetical protein